MLQPHWLPPPPPPPSFLHATENYNLETRCRRSDQSQEASAGSCTACARPSLRGASALGARSRQRRTLRDVRRGCQERARAHANARTLTRKDAAALQGGSPAAAARLAGSLCQGFSCAPWASLGAGVAASCCSVGSTLLPFFSLFSYPPRKVSSAQIEGVVLSQNFSAFDAGPRR